jgi:hypothetical protein
MDSQLLGEEEQKKASDLLGSIVQGKIEDLEEIHLPFLVEGKKINPRLFRYYVNKLRGEGLSDTRILNILLSLDEAIDQGIFNQELISDLKNDPSILVNLS